MLINWPSWVDYLSTIPLHRLTTSPLYCGSGIVLPNAGNTIILSYNRPLEITTIFVIYYYHYCQFIHLHHLKNRSVWRNTRRVQYEWAGHETYAYSRPWRCEEIYSKGSVSSCCGAVGWGKRPWLMVIFRQAGVLTGIFKILVKQRNVYQIESFCFVSFSVLFCIFSSFKFSVPK